MKTIILSISIVIEPPNRWNANLKHMLHLGNGCSMISAKASFVDRVIYDIWNKYNGVTAKTMKDMGKRADELWYTKK